MKLIEALLSQIFEKVYHIQILIFIRIFNSRFAKITFWISLWNNVQQISIFKNSLLKSRKTRRKRRKRNVHSTVESRPDRFDVEILKMIYEKNQLDMIVRCYFRLRFEITLKKLLAD